MNSKGFTLIELIVVIAITAILSAIILFSISQYINKGKDSNVAGNLAVLVPAGEVYYTSYPNSYRDFCSSDVVVNAFSQMPSDTVYQCYVDESKDYKAWAACAGKFTDATKAYCVDSRGVKRSDMPINSCTNTITNCGS